MRNITLDILIGKFEVKGYNMIVDINTRKLRLIDLAMSLDDDLDSCDWVTETNDLSTEVTYASEVYSQDSSPENCRKYKNALNAYLNALNKYTECSRPTFSNNISANIKLNKYELNRIKCQ